METIGNRITQVREAKNLKKIEFARILGIAPASVTQFEAGKNGVSTSVRHAICYMFGVNRTWLDTGEGEMFDSQITAEEIMPDLVSVLNHNPAILNAVRKAIATMNVNDWEKLNNFIAALGEKES